MALFLASNYRKYLYIGIALIAVGFSAFGWYLQISASVLPPAPKVIELKPAETTPKSEEKAPKVEGKVSVKLEESGCKIQEGNIRLRFDYFLDPSAPGYDIHHVYVIDETSKEFLAGYPGKVDKMGNPIDQKDYDKWEASLPHVWRNNPFVCVFVYFPSTVTDKEIQDKAINVLNEAYQYWELGLDMRNFRTAESAMMAKSLTPSEKATYDTKLASIIANKEVLSLAP